MEDESVDDDPSPIAGGPFSEGFPEGSPDELYRILLDDGTVDYARPRRASGRETQWRNGPGHFYTEARVAAWKLLDEKM